MRAPAYWILGLGLVLGGIPGAVSSAWEGEEIPLAMPGPSAWKAAIPSASMERIPQAAVAMEDPLQRKALEHQVGAKAPEEPAPAPAEGLPERLVISSISLDAPIVPAGSRVVSIQGRRYREWQAPDRYAAGWHPTSARAGMPGNMVLSGHNNIDGSVFRRLADVKIGDRVWIYTRDRVFLYEVTERHVLLERGQPLLVRKSNARWIGTFPDERLTLTTCWPPWSNSHRLIVIARPVR